MRIRTLKEMPFDKAFTNYNTGRDELCHATGREVDFQDGTGFWNEFEDSDGELHYGR